jgi:hypothetical protein
LRSAVALELVAGKVWALLDAVQPLVGFTVATARVHPEWVRGHGLARRCRFPPRLRKGGAASVLGDSETRPQGPALVEDGKAGLRAGLSRPGQPRRQPDASRPTVCAVPSLNWARAYETGSRPPRGPSDRWPNQVGHFRPVGRSTVHGAPPLSASQAGFGLPTMPGPRQPLLRIYHGRRRLGWEPLERSTDSAGLPG